MGYDTVQLIELFRNTLNALRQRNERILSLTTEQDRVLKVMGAEGVLNVLEDVCDKYEKDLEKKQENKISW